MINIEEICNKSILEELNNIKIYKDFTSLYKYKCKDGWILRTIKDYKIRYKIEKAKHIVHVGCGLLPYSIISLHRQYPDIKYIGIEYNYNRFLIAKNIINKLQLKNIEIIHIEALKYDYSFLLDEDFIFITADIIGEKVFSKIMEKSKAHIYMCAPYTSSNLKNYL